MTFFLDTNACIALINGWPPAVRDRFRRALEVGHAVAVSVVVAYELWYGVARSTRREANRDALEAFLSGPADLIPFDDGDARDAGEIRATLEREGRPIGAYDLLIAAQARRRGMTLVTANVSEFSRITDLAWENWASDSV